eukprot:362067-Chlamydomonas_euryale.AAC.3
MASGAMELVFWGHRTCPSKDECCRCRHGPCDDVLRVAHVHTFPAVVCSCLEARGNVAILVTPWALSEPTGQAWGGRAAGQVSRPSPYPQARGKGPRAEEAARTAHSATCRYTAAATRPPPLCT